MGTVALKGHRFLLEPRQRFASRYPLDFGARIENAVLVAGVGRSGTTWLADFINFDARYRDLFEPFHAWMIPEAGVLKGHWYQRPDDEPPVPFVDYVERVLRGRIRNPWSDRFNRRMLSRRRIVKTIRANLFLGWLARRYPELKIVLLIRHPAAVARSRIQLPPGWEWRPTLAEMLAQPRLLENLGTVQRKLAETATGAFDEHLLTWSVSHRIPFDELPAEAVLPVYYERLRSDPELQIRRIFGFLGREWDSACLDAYLVPSRTTRKESKDEVCDPGTEASWVQELPFSARERMGEILDAFGLTELYNENGRPGRPDARILAIASAAREMRTLYGAPQRHR